MRRFCSCIAFVCFAACRASVFDECEEAAVCDPESLPAEFAIVTAAPGNGVVVLAWERSERADHFTVRRGTSPGVYDTSLSESASSPFLDSTVAGGTTYYYMVTAANADGTRDAKTEVSATPLVGESLGPR